MARDNSKGGDEGKVIRALLRKNRGLYQNDAARIPMIIENLEQAASEASTAHKMEMLNRRKDSYSSMSPFFFCRTVLPSPTCQINTTHLLFDIT